nr:unnamed protein product [Callosobruchus analis]
MLISRGKQPSAPPIIINNRAINYIENYKYLGVTINQNLKWNQQISTMVNKANQGLNIIKTFCRTSWGADPKTMQIAVNALVRSRLDYGSFLILPTSIKNISKLNTVFHASLRVVSGCMKSTPIEALLAENSVMDLHHRRIWLSAKVITKNISYINHPLIEEIKTLSHSCSNNSYWRNKNTPYLVCAYKFIEEFENSIQKYSKLPCYQTGYFTQLHVAKVINLNIKKNDSAARYKFLEYTDKYKNSHNFIYTDASKIKHRVGCAVHIPGKSINLTTRLPDHMDICSAEMTASLHACKLIIEHNLSKNLIFTDSKSAIDKLINPSMNANKDCICFDAQLALWEANSNGKETLLIWIPGHNSIRGNEVVDQLAKLAANLNVPIEIKLNKSDLLTIAKNTVKKKFKAEWKVKSQSGNNWYSKIQTDFPETPWHAKYPYINRRHVTTIIRMRTGHCATNQHLYKIGMKDTPLCHCGEVQTLNHLFLECLIYKNSNADIYNICKDINITLPTDMQIILANLSPKLIKAIIRFIQLNNLNI